MKHTPEQLKNFQRTVLSFYEKHGRELPWRIPDGQGSFDPYTILVSEIMLQQTQVSRAAAKYHQFLSVFPTVQVLAEARLGNVLREWSGLGYNRRAKYLHEAAITIQSEYDGRFPVTLNMLTKLPGIGKNTAGAVLAYAYNQPAVFIETNIRTVFIYHFFKGSDDVSDAAILPLVEKTLDVQEPRIWYWALMDYGTYLKSSQGNLARRSRHYVRQSAFEGSKRQLRGKILRLLAENGLTKDQLAKEISDKRLNEAIGDLLREKLIIQRADASYSLFPD